MRVVTTTGLKSRRCATLKGGVVIIVKLKSDLLSENLIRETFFVGKHPRKLRNAGSITLNIDEWQLLGAAFLLGVDQIKTIRSRQHVPSDVDVLLEQTFTL